MPHLRVEIVKAHNGIVRFGSAWCVEGVGPWHTLGFCNARFSSSYLQRSRTILGGYARTQDVIRADIIAEAKNVLACTPA
jgi:hypothetical protein